MTVKRLHAHAMVDDDAVSVNTEVARIQHLAVIGGRHGRVRGLGEIEAEMNLTVDVFAAIHISTKVGERGFNLSAAERLKRSVPEHLRRGLLAERRNFLVVDATQIVV